MIRDNPAQALEELADAFESGRLKWNQGSYSLGDNSFCIVGALWASPLGAKSQQSLLHAIASVVDPQNALYAPHTAVTTWNDTYGRTLDEVVDALKHAAKNLHNQS